MQNNYLTSAFPAHSLLKLWIDEDQKSSGNEGQKTRQLIFISSAAALCNPPNVPNGHSLTLSAAIYSTATCQYKVHCAFPNTFMTDAFLDEQKTKPDLTKRIESSDGPIEKLKTKMLSAEYVAEYIVKGVAKGDFALVSDFDTEVLWSNMVGSSPKRGFGLVDSILGLLSGFLVWPILRFIWTRMCTQTQKKSM
ncbi:short chain dehydrogenase reductase family [Colletotrichum kahawae]|uniref:Short chain dehydrogenase reductase family n=1 Tax=Colletotrichum kahawae TaxID=34407 RepID=A0AAD9Y587_COLKA|nr:short chain dehydrogenase reductase family [Colletotrichum kahawae]